MSDLSLNNGILTWDILIDDVVSDVADLSPLITFVEIA